MSAAFSVGNFQQSSNGPQASFLDAEEQRRARLERPVDQPVTRAAARLPGAAQRRGGLAVHGAEQEQEPAAQVVQAARGHLDGRATLGQLLPQSANGLAVEETSGADVSDQLVVVAHALADQRGQRP
jgi:hypothetical protein